MATRKADSVLPEPVGAATSVSRPAAMGGQRVGLGRGGPVGEAAAEPGGHGRMEAARTGGPRGPSPTTVGVSGPGVPPPSTSVLMMANLSCVPSAPASLCRGPLPFTDHERTFANLLRGCDKIRPWTTCCCCCT